MNVPTDLAEILAASSVFKSAYLVGGCVRDSILQLQVKDFDIEVFGVSYQELLKALEPWGRADLVGKSFGVVKLRSKNGENYDFSIPRRDSKTSVGHKGFKISFDETLQPEEASARRDFTINSMMFHVAAKELLDHHGGLQDLRAGILRHTSDAFGEDPLRVLRGFQFVSRFELEAAPETIRLCRSMAHTYPELPVERVRDEWIKWATQSKSPKLGLGFLSATGWLQHYPELAAMEGTPQDVRWHPEGDVWIHTNYCCDALVGLPEWRAQTEEDKLCLMLAVLTHDIGKPGTTQLIAEDGNTRISSPAHETKGLPLAESLLKRLGMPIRIIEGVLPLIQNHMIPAGNLNERGVRRLSKRLEPATIPKLCLVMQADRGGRPPRTPKSSEDLELLMEKARLLTVDKGGPKPLIQGRHLIQRGWVPGPNFKKILDEAYEAQLDGQFTTAAEAENWLNTRLSK
ncbi:MAG: polynucleotide adenylyltransferase [Verrucomicrobiales bacterium]|nr:polynucleotide adenylyltransferase [Verrucomicrobiales bacterium]